MIYCMSLATRLDGVAGSTPCILISSMALRCSKDMIDARNNNSI